MYITHSFLDDNPNAVYVFGDNTIRRGKGGAARLRDHPQAVGFITKKYPNNNDGSFFRPDEYRKVYSEEIDRLHNLIKRSPEKTFYICKVGSQLANKHQIFEEVIEPNLKLDLIEFDNQIVWLW